MELRLLKELVKQGEGNRLEFKLKTNHPEKIIREIVAFANTNGGKLLVGVDDDKRILGVKDINEDEFLLNRAIEKLIFPKLDYQHYRVSLDTDRQVLVLNIPKSTNKPHYVIDSSGERKAYVRVEDRSVQASREMKEIMRRGRHEKDIRFRYGEKEKKLMELLEQHPSVTVDLFATFAGIPRKIASNTLVILVLARVLEIHPQEMIDHFTMSISYQNT